MSDDEPRPSSVDKSPQLGQRFGSRYQIKLAIAKDATLDADHPEDVLVSEESAPTAASW